METYGNCSSSVRPTHSISWLRCCETCLLEAHFQGRNSHKPLGARSGECGGWVMCGSVQKPLSLPALVEPLPLQTCTWKWPVTLFRLHELMAHQTVDVRAFRELFDWPAYNLIQWQCHRTLSLVALRTVTFTLRTVTPVQPDIWHTWESY
jgi:hypothetical protein